MEFLLGLGVGFLARKTIQNFHTSKILSAQIKIIHNSMDSKNTTLFKHLIYKYSHAINYRFDNSTCLMKAVVNNDKEFVDILLEHPCINLKTTDKNGRDIIYYVDEFCKNDAIKNRVINFYFKNDF
jgi:hypothetical protein